ncbi:VOC family protein [Bacillus sp. NPDC094077]|uniref:VOC family protein n=1 Tax=Bacillus sp. NPDC094077 TaxID=3390932 RepID=UPI003D01DBE1
MKIDHLVVNVNKEIQENKETIKNVHSIGLPYVPKWGKGTKGFKVSNIWIGKEYLELVRVKTKDGGGWVQDWVRKYNDGHRGLIGLAIDVENIDNTYEKMIRDGIKVTKPEPLQFRWFFNLFKKTMPWKNAYIQPMKGMPFQFFLQQMKDQKSREYMEKYMYPNSVEEGVTGIVAVKLYGEVTNEDRNIIGCLFSDVTNEEKEIIIRLKNQVIHLIQSNEHFIEIMLDSNNEAHKGKKLNIENITLINV